MSLLPDAESFRRLADGSLTGPGATIARVALATLALPYGLVASARNALYDRGLLAVGRIDVPIISVGNVTVGGTGKTPLVVWVCRRLAALGRRPAVVSRGYGARRGEASDEAAELSILLPGVDHVANRDRLAAVRTATGRQADVIVLDDGFQHRRLHRDLDLVAIDASDPFGCGHLLPRGLLRESVAGLARADAIVLTRASSVDEARREAIHAAVERARGGRRPAAWLETEHRPTTIRTAGGETLPLDSIRGRRVAAFCGIGNPAAFRRTLADAGAEIVGFRGFADHHRYRPAELDELGSWADRVGAGHLLTTLKDLVRIRLDRLGGVPLCAIEVAIEPLTPVADLDLLLAKAVDAGAACR